jgi:fatty-acyl-CoA synthase
MGALEQLGYAWRGLRLGLPIARLRPGAPRSVADVVEEQAAARPAHPFLLFEGRRVSYAAFDAAANRVARWARAQGLGPGDRVALLMQNRPEYLETWVGLAKVGVTTALINTNLTGRALGHAIGVADPKHAIVGAECVPALATLDGDAPWQLHVAREAGVEPSGSSGDGAALPPGAHDLAAELAACADAPLPRDVRGAVRAGDDLFYIYTSGTTGLPKAAHFSHLRFLATATGARIAGFDPDDVMYCALPLYHTAGGVMAVGAALLAGGTVALRRKFSAREFWSDVRRHEATAFQYIGEFCRYLLHVPPDPRDGEHGVRFCIGNGLRPDIWAAFRDRFRIPRIVEFYGATEGNVALMNLEGREGSVGRRPSRLMMDARLVRYDVERDEHVRDARGRLVECGPGEPGELIGALPRRDGELRGRFEGYTSSEATERKILRDGFAPGDAWFRTGDLLRSDAQGYFYFVDRIGDTFRWKGENVSTQEVAEAIGSFPGVRMCNVYGVEVPGSDGRAGMAALALDDPARFAGDALYAHALATLPPYAAPVFVRLQDDADVTGTFKLRKVDLQREGWDPARIAEPLFVRDDGARAYVPLTPERHAAIHAGERRL